ncbi:MAG: hypothetical protein AAF957_05690 [Planctomycetota bacterium]
MITLHRTAAAAALLACVACQNPPTLESIRYGYSPSRVQAESEQPNADDYNDMASGWSPERAPGSEPVLRGWDGSPVGASTHGTITETSKPINGGVDVDGPGGGSRSMLLDLYTEAVEEREELTRANGDLQTALEISEERAAELEQQLQSLQVHFDELGTAKQQVEQQSFDLAARLATAQIARLEAERALLEATLEWRRMSKANNRSLTESDEGRR